MFPLTAYAFNVDQTLLRINEQIINPLIMLLFALALVFFIWGVVEFIGGSDNEEKRTKGRQHIIWGLVGLTIMASVFGIINIIINTLGIGGADGINVDTDGNVEINISESVLGE